MTDCRSVSTPLDKNLKLRLDSGADCNEKRFRQIVRSLTYLTITRLNLSYAVGVISHSCNDRQSNSSSAHFEYYATWAARRTEVFCKRHDITKQLVGYTDVDWAGNAKDHRSASGFMFSLGSVVVTWSSKKQPIVALSSTKTKYRGLVKKQLVRLYSSDNYCRTYGLTFLL